MLESPSFFILNPGIPPVRQSRWIVRIWVCAVLAFLPAQSRAIINGTEAGEDEFPSTAAILKKGNFPAPALIGAGSLVGDQWIVTAAHNLISEGPGTITIFLGSNDLTGSGITRNALAIYRHPDFDTENGASSNDIAMILLDQPVSTVPTVPFITDSGDIGVNDDTVVAGWGTTTPGEIHISNLLRKVDARILSRAFANSFFSITLGDEHLPARDPAESGNPCHGDSGGPMIQSIGAVETLVGLVSFGDDDCDDASIPSIYTNVVEFAPWMTSYLDLTVEPSAIRVTGKGKTISDGDKKSRRADGTDFGRISSKRRKVTKSFQVANLGAGLLTVRAASVSGRSFSVRRSPSTITGSGGSSSMKLTFRAKGKRRKHRGTVRLFTNDPTTPVHSFRVQARVR